MSSRFISTQVLVAVFLWLGVAGPCNASIVAYLDEGAYLAALASLGLDSVHEGFEDDSVWGTVRTTIPGGAQLAPSITSQGVTWTSNTAIGNVTTSEGAALSGDWGFYSLPHGDFSGPDHTDDIPDGFSGFSSQTLFGIGGWIGTNTPYADISLYLDSVSVDFGNGNPTLIGPTPSFFGVIDTSGFNSFLWQETEGTFDDQKFIFGDDFTVAMAPSAPIPEPASVVLLLVGLLSLVAWRTGQKLLCQ